MSPSIDAGDQSNPIEKESCYRKQRDSMVRTSASSLRKSRPLALRDINQSSNLTEAESDDDAVLSAEITRLVQKYSLRE
jgi:hypothetical protein